MSEMKSTVPMSTVPMSTVPMSTVPMYDNNVDYQTALLKLFTLTDFNIDKINKSIHELYIICADDEDIVYLMKAANTLTHGDDELGLMILHSYDYLYLFNQYLQYKKTRNPLEIESYKSLLAKLIR
jgi:hypothetical protein